MWQSIQNKLLAYSEIGMLTCKALIIRRMPILGRDHQVEIGHETVARQLASRQGLPTYIVSTHRATESAATHSPHAAATHSTLIRSWAQLAKVSPFLTDGIE